VILLQLSPLDIVIGLIAIVALAIFALKARAIDLPGAIAGAVITFVTFLAGGFAWLFVIVAFFVISAIFTRVRYEYKASLGGAQEKGGTRSWPNTLANGLVAAAAGVLELFFHQSIFAIAFLGAIAAAMSDTIATEVGLLSRSNPRAINNLGRLVKPGTSGGVSLLGEIAAISSSLGIAVLAIVLRILPSNIQAVYGFIAILIGGFLGTNLDSLLGATLQARRKCVVCGEITESSVHHEKKTTVVRGSGLIDNNVVNLLASFSGAAFAMIIFALA
jgi:uncharacterized protein (TIGR00297 family)